MFDHIIGVSMKREERFTNVKEFSMGKDKFKTFSLLLTEELLQNRHSILYKKEWLKVRCDLYKLIVPHDQMVTLAFMRTFGYRGCGWDEDERPHPNKDADIINITFEPVDRNKFNHESMASNPTDRNIKELKDEEYDIYRVGFLRWNGVVYKGLYSEDKVALGYKRDQDYVFHYVWIPHEVVIDPDNHMDEFRNIANWIHIKLMDRIVSENLKHCRRVLPYNHMPDFEDDDE